MAFGPIQILAVGFASNDRFEGRIADELIAASDAGTIRLIDVLFVIREDDEVGVMRASDLDEEQREELGAAVGALIGLGAAGIDGFVEGAELGAEVMAEGGLGILEDIADDLVEELPEGTSALLLIIEHRWAIGLRDAVLDAGGVLLANRWLGIGELVSLGAALAEETAD
jgi:uncharacterized membrane protein